MALPFAYGSATPPPDAAASLAPIRGYLAGHADASAVVDGHADPSGDDAGNLVLSRRRARRVADLLAAGGVPRAQIVERAFGAYVPLVDASAGARRRVRVAIHDRSCAQEDRP